MTRSMPPRGGYDQDPDNGNGNGHDLSAEQALMVVERPMHGFTDQDQLAQFVEGLSNMVSQDGGMYGANQDRMGRAGQDQVPPNNLGAIDRGRSGRRTGRDTGMHRPGAMDSALRPSKSFAQRFPETAGVEVWWNRSRQ